MDLLNIGQTIKQRRTFLKIKQEDLAEISGISLRTLRNIEHGDGNPEMKSLFSILEALGLQIKIEIKK